MARAESVTSTSVKGCRLGEHFLVRVSDRRPLSRRHECAVDDADMPSPSVRRRLPIALLCLLAVAHAPAPDDADAVVRTLVAQDAAVTQVGERLSMAALPLCRDRGWAPGIVLQTRSQYGDAYRVAAVRTFGLGDRPTVSVIVPAGAGARAGLRVGDQIVEIDGQPTKVVAANARVRIDDLQQVLDQLDGGLADGRADLTILRGGQTSVVALAPPPACRARFEVRAGRSNNASAGSLTVQVSSDLVDPARGAADLAPLVAHELAHVILRHDAVLQRHRGGLLPGFGRSGAALRTSELEADRLSVYLLALAGYDPNDAVQFWSRFGRANDYGILSDRTHPGWKTRVAAVQAEVDRVAQQRTRGEAIQVPDDLKVTSLR